MAELGEANIGGRMVPAWLLNLTAEELDSLKSRWYSNPNLLDNWYFGNPVNQRGQTSWTNPSNWQYSIDRWQITPSSVIALVDGGITITADFHQGLEKGRLEFGRTYTFSVLSSDGRLGKHTFVLTSDPNINVSFGFGYFVCYLSGGNVWFRIYGDGSTYKAAKLELGSQQTLAHQDANGNWVLNEIPDYGEQLRRCQRYFQVLKSGRGAGLQVNSAKCYVPISLPVPLRTNPTVSIVGSVGVWNGRMAPATSIVVNQYAGGCEIILDLSTTDAVTGTCIAPYANTENIKNNFVCLSADL